MWEDLKCRLGGELEYDMNRWKESRRCRKKRNAFTKRKTTGFDFIEMELPSHAVRM